MGNLMHKDLSNGHLITNGKLSIILLYKNILDIKEHIYKDIQYLPDLLKENKLNPSVWKAEVDRMCALAEYIVSPSCKFNIFDYLPLTKDGNFPKNNNILIATSKYGYGASYAGGYNYYPVSQKLQIRLVPAYTSDMDWIHDKRMDNTVILKVDLFDGLKKQQPVIDENGTPHKIETTRATYLKDDQIMPGRVYEEKSGTQFICITGCIVEVNHIEYGIGEWSDLIGNFHTYIKWTKTLEKALGNDTSFNNLIRVLASKDKVSSIKDRVSMREHPRKFTKEVKVLFDKSNIKPEIILGAKYKDYNGYHQCRYVIK